MTHYPATLMTKARLAMLVWPDTISNRKWNSHGYRYYFRKMEAGTFTICAGCRSWYNFAEMRRYYRPNWRHPDSRRQDCYPYDSWTEKAREKHRKQSLAVADEMQRFAVRIGLNMAKKEPISRAKKRVQRKNKKARVGKVSRQRRAVLRRRAA